MNEIYKQVEEKLNHGARDDFRCFAMGVFIAIVDNNCPISCAIPILQEQLEKQLQFPSNLK